MRVLKATHAPLSFDIVDNIVDKVHSSIAGTRSWGGAVYFLSGCVQSLCSCVLVCVFSFYCCGPGTLRVAGAHTAAADAEPDWQWVWHTRIPRGNPASCWGASVSGRPIWPGPASRSLRGTGVAVQSATLSAVIGARGSG
jgi:hypothetical protein